MNLTYAGQTLLRGLCGLLLCGLMAGTIPALAEDGETDFEGTVELLYRSLSIDGSERKYDEDFDGLESGGRLGNLSLNWNRIDSSIADYARITASGLGGDPFERTAFRIGRQDRYDLKFEHTEQDYLYNLFGLVPTSSLNDEDGHIWDTESRRTNATLTLYPTKNVDLVFGFNEHDRTGDSFFMKDVSRDVFLMETPIDRETRRYTVGGDFRIGPVDLVFRQELRRYNNDFDNRTEGDLGLDTADMTVLDVYEWQENHSSSADLTTLRVNALLHDRVTLNVGYYGTALGEEEVESNVSLFASGTAFNGAPLLFDDGFAHARIDQDTSLIDADVSVILVQPLTLRLGYRTLEQDADGVLQRDLEATGTTTTFNTTFDYEVDTATAELQLQAHRTLALRGGYRTTDRELVRDGFGTLRDEDFKSDGDESLLFGFSWNPAKWIRLSGDYEDDDIEASFSNVSPLEREHLRGRVTVRPQSDMRIGLTYTDFEANKPTSEFAAMQEGESWSLTFAHDASEFVDYSLSYGMWEVDYFAEVIYDSDAFGGPAATFPGRSIFGAETDVVSALINFHPTPDWDVYLQASVADSEAFDLADGNDPSATPATPLRLDIDQDFTDSEVGVRYRFDSGIFIGGDVRYFDYSELNKLLDYDGTSLTLRAGMTF